jgi:hypothetical protein
MPPAGVGGGVSCGSTGRCLPSAAGTGGVVGATSVAVLDVVGVTGCSAGSCGFAAQPAVSVSTKLACRPIAKHADSGRGRTPSARAVVRGLGQAFLWSGE